MKTKQTRFIVSIEHLYLHSQYIDYSILSVTTQCHLTLLLLVCCVGHLHFWMIFIVLLLFVVWAQVFTSIVVCRVCRLLLCSIYMLVARFTDYDFHTDVDMYATDL